jgi:hypothetical protein
MRRRCQQRLFNVEKVRLSMLAGQRDARGTLHPLATRRGPTDCDRWSSHPGASDRSCGEPCLAANMTASASHIPLARANRFEEVRNRFVLCTMRTRPRGVHTSVVRKSQIRQYRTKRPGGAEFGRRFASKSHTPGRGKQTRPVKLPRTAPTHPGGPRRRRSGVDEAREGSKAEACLVRGRWWRRRGGRRRRVRRQGNRGKRRWT